MPHIYIIEPNHKREVCRISISEKFYEIYHLKELVIEQGNDCSINKAFRHIKGVLETNRPAIEKEKTATSLINRCYNILEKLKDTNQAYLIQIELV